MKRFLFRIAVTAIAAALALAPLASCARPAQGVLPGQAQALAPAAEPSPELGAAPSPELSSEPSPEPMLAPSPDLSPEPVPTPSPEQSPEPSPAFEQPPVGIAVGQTAPDFTLSLRGGGSVTLWELRGAPVLLNVCATWCPPCQLEYPEIQAVHDAYAGRAAVLGVDIGESEADVDAYLDQFGYGYAIAYDPDGTIGGDYKIDFIPQTWVIDANGVIAGYIAGATDYGEFSAALEDALA
jgi:thiol-disulfide isomerase/thioredoxin